MATKLGSGKKPAVRITINGYTYRSSVAVMGRRFMVGVNAENREKAKVAGGDKVDVDIEVDAEPRIIETSGDDRRSKNYPPTRKTILPRVRPLSES